MSKHGNWQELSKGINNAAKKTFEAVRNKKKVWCNEMCRGIHSDNQKLEKEEMLRKNSTLLTTCCL